ncbi:fatty acid synthase-like [Achroia grisella]|uniref:fatty acid synthase-like n=1 Tax=Achroia grisella TaxID=688607 RepID=UPI0027D260AE|nr:fatty acid synthase-like [Achroia grisella]
MASTSLESRIISGYKASQPSPGEEIYITGISGSFPNSDSVVHLQENLFNKVDLVTSDNRRWIHEHPEIPHRIGKINNVAKFDASFFNINYKQAHTMDPMCRVILEKVYEAIFDAGLNPEDLRNTRTGVFVGSCFSESEKTWFYDKMHFNNYAIVGCCRAMLSNRISHWLGVTGPSYTVDTACSSSLYAVEHAFRAIRDGHCDAAIVGGSNLCLHPFISLQFYRLGVLCQDGTCKSFDNKANGYARSEAVSVCILQKAKDSKRVYAQVLHTKTNCDGYKEQGITYPSGSIQKLLLSEFYEECAIPPSSLEFLEAHGTGTQIGDPEELLAIDEVFTAGRSEPLLIGSMKSNLGHTEAASGLCSVSKMCIAYNTGFIPPNLHYNTPRDGVAALSEGRLKVVTEKQPWNRGLCGISSFGFGGANAHILLKNSAREKVNNGLPTDDLPRLVCVSGRTESAVARILDDLESRTVDVEQIRLLHDIFDKNIVGHKFRGFTLLGSTPTRSVPLARDIRYFSGLRRPIWFMYSGIGTQWSGVATTLMTMPAFDAAIEKCHKILKPKGINLTKIVTDVDYTSIDNILNSFIGIVAIQIGLTDVLKTIGVEPDYIIGHCVGELVCAYADGCFTAEQTIMAAYSQGLAFTETKLIKGSMAMIGASYDQINSICPLDIDVASYNGPNSVTISGPADVMKRFITKLSAQDIFVKEIPCSNIAFHSRYTAETGHRLLKYLKKVIPSPTVRSKRWVSTSVPQSLWKSSKAELSSAEYHTNNILSPVLFEETSRLINKNAVIIDLASHGSLQTFLEQSMKKDIINISLLQKSHSDNKQILLVALGKLFESGINPHLANLYPNVVFPVSRGTPMLSHLVEWEHGENWYVTCYNKAQDIFNCAERMVKMSLKDEQSEFLSGHVVNGRNLYPATGYLVLVWETFDTMGKLCDGMSVIFEDVRFHRATNIPKDGQLIFIISIHRSTGNFEITESGISIVTGRILAKENVGQDFRVLPTVPEVFAPNMKHMLTKDFYKELRLRGYQYSGLFRGVLGCTIEGTRGRLAWVNNWVTFMDCMLQLKIIAQDTRGLFVPTRIETLSIDVNMHYNAISKMNVYSKDNSFEVRVYPAVNVIRAGGVEIRGLHAAPIPKRVPLGEPVLEKYKFIPNFEDNEMKIQDTLRANIQMILENVPTYKVKSIELVDDEYKNNGLQPMTEEIYKILGDIPLVQSELLLICDEAIEMPNPIIVENKKLSGESNAVLFVGANLLQRESVLNQAAATLRDKCFIISREKSRPDPNQQSKAYDIITMQNIGSEYLILLRKRIITRLAEYVKIESADDDFSWVEIVKEKLKLAHRIVLYTQNESINGLLGLVNCLRREPGGEIVSGVLITDPAAPAFDHNLMFYKKQLQKDLAINVYQNGQWVSYRHLLLSNLDRVQAHHAFVNTLTIGYLSSLSWIEGHIRKDVAFKNPNSILVHVYCAAVNFRDIMIATGRVTADVIATGRLAQECVQGFEIVGRTQNGSRVMCMLKNSAIANMVESDKNFTYYIPDEFTFEEAATIPVTYGTAYYAMVGVVALSSIILIHAGTGGVGQASIYLALHYGLEVFTTVSTPEKRSFIKKLFPQLKDSHIGNSRDTSFEDMIRRETNGKGVDLVLNSLSDDKLHASVRCLGYRGRFLEIGKYDISNNTYLDVAHKELSFHGIVLDHIFEQSKEYKQIVMLYELILSGLNSGAVRPLTYCTFEKDDIETAYRYMAAGKHIGKIIIKIRDEERNVYTKPTCLPIEAIPRYMCNEEYVYVIVGGLGGFGLELADWCILRGARKVLLASRKGISNGYQSYRLRAWASYGADVQISSHDVTTESGCEKMLKMANDMGPVEAIFNLAVILKDAIFQNQTAETFKISFAPKALVTLHLDKLSTILCPRLKNFVVFSSVSCGRGNAGQTNYGLSNSLMERICERRKKHGLPALAVQWGAIGDVGLVADMQDEDIQLEIGGTLQQRISSCLLTLDKFLKQDFPIVSSMLVAEKKTRSANFGTIVDAVAQIMGINDLKTVSQQVSLADLGMDSITAVEIKQTLEREFEVFLTAQDIRTITFARLLEITTQCGNIPSAVTKPNTEVEASAGLKVLLRNFAEEKLVNKPIIYMPTLVSDGFEKIEAVNEKLMIMLPGLEGCAAVLEPLCRKLQVKVCVLQLGIEHVNENCEEMVERLYQLAISCLEPRSKFWLLGYSFGCLLTLELAAKLESEGYKGAVFCLDGSPEFLYSITTSILNFNNDVQIQNSIICHTINKIVPSNDITKTLKQKLNGIDKYEDKIKYAIEVSSVQTNYSKEFISCIARVSFDRIKVILNHNLNDVKKLQSPIILMRPKDTYPFIKCKDNYGLDKFSDSSVIVHLLDGNHVSIVENKDVADIINNVISDKDE